ncbi:unnamed protein product [Lepeophtheirus salmonis]|uniref:(salmon louse) hypothetical protein n=1 Tax=Lepeophtheirus salmonis TaxID=72036 RepID=A0A7R8H6G5_LEPSM|nr:unnamed protein product [Lepeophtheirus salmonis]CAF2882578.1 unnamed protein product [Lepeophtheirus salmonis]
MSSNGVNLNNQNNLVSQSNSPSYRSIDPISNSQISQKQNSVNNAEGHSSPSFGSNVQSATNGLYRSQNNDYLRNPISSSGVNLNSQNISQSNSPSYRSIGPIDNSEISQKQNSVNNAEGHSSPSLEAMFSLLQMGYIENNLVSQSNSPSYRSIGPFSNNEISQKQNSVNNAGRFSSPSFGSNVQSATNGLYRRQPSNYLENPISSTGVNLNNKNIKFHKKQNSVNNAEGHSSPSFGSNVQSATNGLYRSQISQKQNSVNNAEGHSSPSFGNNVQSATNGRTNNYPETPLSNTGINVNSQNNLVSQSNSPSYRSIGPIDNSEISQKQNSVNNAGGYSSASFGSNVQSGTNGLYRSQTNNLLGNPLSSTGINVNNQNDLVSQSNSPSYRSIGPIDNNEISQKQNSVNNAGGYSSASFEAMFSLEQTDFIEVKPIIYWEIHCLLQE